jgi:hypothetical protein
MTDTAKPTPGPWYYVPYPAGIGGFVNAGDPSGPAICDLSKYEHPETNGRFIAEAGTVFHETGLTPRQLLEQRDELREALNDVIAMAKAGRVVHVMNRAKAALAKCGKVGG